MPHNTDTLIDNGPNKLDLMLSLWDTEVAMREVNFALSIWHGSEEVGLFFLQVQITSIRRDDDAATLFTFEGTCNYSHVAAKASGQYSVKTRKGTLTITH